MFVTFGKSPNNISEACQQHEIKHVHIESKNNLYEVKDLFNQLQKHEELAVIYSFTGLNHTGMIIYHLFRKLHIEPENARAMIDEKWPEIY